MWTEYSTLLEKKASSDMQLNLYSELLTELSS